MRKPVVVLALVVAACGGGGGLDTAEGELAAATFLVEADAGMVEVVGRDRLAGTGGTEDRLDVIRPGGELSIVPIHGGTPVPDPLEFVRDPLAAGAVEPMLDQSDRVIAVVYPLIDPTPGGRVLRGSLLLFGPGGNLMGTDWGDEADAVVSELLAWGAERGMAPLPTLELAVRGLGGAEGEAAEAADFLR